VSLVRAYKPEDLDALRSMHARQGFDYGFPDVEDETFLGKLVLEDDGVRMAALLRLTAEAYFLHDPQAGTPAKRWSNFLLLHEEMRRRARASGLEDVYCWIPPEVPPRRPLPEKRRPRGFERKLEMLGWQSCRWRCYTRKTAP